MEWKWVKSLLIILFLVLNCFLGYQVYQRNSIAVINVETEEALRSILNSKNITCNFKMSDIQIKRYMQKIKISNEETIEEKFISISSIDNKNTEYTGRNREIVSISSMLVSFIRETKVSDVNIEKIDLGYYPEISQFDKNILSGEATPAWFIELSDGSQYVYNAYVGDRIINK